MPYERFINDSLQVNRALDPYQLDRNRAVQLRFQRSQSTTKVPVRWHAIGQVVSEAYFNPFALVPRRYLHVALLQRLLLESVVSNLIMYN